MEALPKDTGPHEGKAFSDYCAEPDAPPVVPENPPMKPPPCASGDWSGMEIIGLVAIVILLASEILKRI